jgi:hypothetical protein
MFFCSVTSEQESRAACDYDVIYILVVDSRQKVGYLV